MSDSTSVSSVSRKRGRPRRDDSVKGNVKKKIATLTEAKKKNSRVLRNSTVALRDKSMGPPITPTQNRFSVLSADKNTITGDSSTNLTNAVKPNIPAIKRQYIPPIVIEGSNYNAINNLLKTNNIIEFKIKLISLGVKLTLINLESYNKVKIILQNNKIEHFSFSSRDQNPLKIILTGLPEMKSDDLKDELIKNKIESEIILEIIPLKLNERNYNVNKNINYLFKFDKDKIKFNDICRIKSLFNVIVRWYPYVNNRKGPTQCRNCQMYGHGTSHCGKLTKCMKCGKNHKAENCTEAAIKCANCNNEHEANSKDCPNRHKYVAIRQNIVINRQLDHLKNSPPKINNSQRNYKNINFNENNFPGLQKRRSSFDQNNFFSHFTQSQPLPSTSYAFSSQPKPSTQNEKLFTIEELTELVSELLEKISMCTTKAQQFKVIMKLSLQFLGTLPAST